VIAARLSGYLAKWLAALQENSYLILEKIENNSWDSFLN